jgi:undecaprenyl phosphate N,N'-diacetylbacillosamine 1-phosphate transferase
MFEVLYRRSIKRLLDIIFSLSLMPVLLFFIILIGGMIRLEDGGPIFYNSYRLGRNGIPFKMIKFRSMHTDAPDLRMADGSTFNSLNDSRQTKIGKYLRRWSIDEIPQIVNVMKGEMSFIGPRPDPIDWLDKYSTEEMVFLTCMPGITGYNQAFYRNQSDAKTKIANDVYYAKNLSLKLDLEILLQTIVVVFTSKNIYKSS